MRECMTDLINSIKSRKSCIWIKTQEESLTIKDIRQISMINLPKANIVIWSQTEGATIYNSVDNSSSGKSIKKLANIDNLFSFIKLNTYGGTDNNDKVVKPEPNIFILRDYNNLFNDPKSIRFIRDLKEYHKQKEAYNPIIILSQIDNIPTQLTRLFKLIDYGLPNRNEILSCMNETINNIKAVSLKQNKQCKIPTQEGLNNLVNSCLGLTIQEIQETVIESFIKFKEANLDFITQKKIESIQKSGVLDYKIPNTTLEDIGGNEVIKQWLLEMKELFSDEAKEFGLKKPKGYLSVGVPGAGKTCLAEAFAGTMHMPLLSLSMGRIMSRFVGESERKIMQALDVAKASAPCVLLIDEVEKALGGINSSNNTDGGVTARVFMEILKFLNDNDYGVYIIMTSNDVSQLPPELTRQGRLDAKWFFDFPKENERKEIFKIHFSKYNKEINSDLLDLAVSKTNNFTGAEIQEIVKNTIRKSFIRFKKDNNDELKEEDITSAINEIIPISKTSKESILALKSYCSNRFRSVNEENDYDDDDECLSAQYQL
jgi:SpoVK/Ycf46/Vps4 family AAA+-type ATPase